MVASKLEEAVLECLDTEKDAYLYYLLRLHPSRTIVFCTAISAVRRIYAILRLLQVRISLLAGHKPSSLHGFFCNSLIESLCGASIRS